MLGRHIREGETLDDGQQVLEITEPDRDGLRRAKIGNRWTADGE
jgi:hypothetical protein